MPVYHLCLKCKNTFGLKHKKCPRCGTPVPKQGRMYYVRVMVNGRRVSKVVPGSLVLARQIESKIKSELVAGNYYKKRQTLLWVNFGKSIICPMRNRQRRAGTPMFIVMRNT